MPNINDLRSALGSASEGRSDEELLSAYAQASGAHPAQVAAQFGFAPSNNGKWANRAAGSIDNSQSQLYGIGEAMGLGNWARRGRISNKFMADVEQGAARAQGAVMGMDDVKGIGDIPEYIGGLAIDSAPQMGATLAAGLAGGPVAAGAVGYGFATGDILENQREQAGKTDLLSASLLAVPYAAVDTFSGVGKLASKAKFAKSGIRALDNVQGFAGGAARTAASMGRTALEEGVGETFQEGMNQLGRMAVDPNAQFLSPDAQKRYLESFVGGAALGGAMGGIGGHRRSDSYRAPGEVPGAPVSTWDGKTPTWDTAQGFEPSGQPAPAHPLGDLTPNWNFADYAPGKPNEGSLSFFEAPDWDLGQGFEGVKQANAAKRGQKVYEPVDGTTVDEFTEVPRSPVMAQAATAAVGPINEQVAQAQAAQQQAAQVQQEEQAAQAAEQADPAVQEAQSRAQAIVEKANEVAAKVQARKQQAESLGLPKGKAAFEAYQGLADLHDAGKITDDQLAYNIGLLKAREFGNVKRFIKAIPIIKPDATTSENPGEEGAVATRPQGQVQTVGNQVAGIDENKVATIGRSDRKVQVNPAQMQEKLRTASNDEKAIIMAATGLRFDRDPTTGKPILLQTDSPMTMKEISDLHGTSPQNINNTLMKFGLTKDVVDAVATSRGLENVASDADIGMETHDTAEGEAKSAPGFRIESDASKAFGQGLVQTEEDRRQTPEQRALKADADAMLKGAGSAVAVKEDRAVAEAQAEAAAKAREAENIAHLVKQHGEFAEEWWPSEFPFSKLPDTLKADWIEHLNDIHNTYGHLKYASHGAFEHASNLVLHDYADFQKYQDQTRADSGAVDRHAGSLEGAPRSAGTNVQPTLAASPRQLANDNVIDGAVTDVTDGGLTYDPETGKGVTPTGPAPVVTTKKKRKIEKPTDVQMSQSEERQGSTVARVMTEISKLNLGLDPKKVRVVQSVADLPKLFQQSLEGKRPQGFVFGSRAVLIADNIKPGNARSVLMHEVGVHMGLENLLTAKEFGNLANKLVDWADRNDGSVESTLARKAIARVGAAKTQAHQVHSETVAYFVEEAVRAGIDPTALQYKSEIGRWMAELVRLLKAGLAKLKLMDAAGLTAQDVVDMAYGAAKLEMQVDRDTAASGQKFSIRENDELGRESALRRLYRKAQEAYSEFDSPDAAYDALYAEATPAEKYLLRELKKDDFLGFDYPHQAFRAIADEMRSPNFFTEDTGGNFDLSPGLKRAVSRLGNSQSPTLQFSIADHVPAKVMPAVNYASSAAADFAKNGLKKAMFTKDLAARAASYLEDAPKYIAMVSEAQTAKMKKEREIARIVDGFESLPLRERGTGPASVNAFLQESTMNKAWGFMPEYHKDAKVDAGMAAKFKALSPQAQQLVKDVFKHGHENLQAMKAAVMDNIASEYDAARAEMQKAGDKAGVAKIEADKAKALRDYESLMSQNGNWPYAPLKRFGNQVVVGMSQAYLDAVKADDTETVRAMQDEGKHYMVEFAETRAEAIARRKELEQSGAFAAVQDFERDDASQALHGRDVLSAFGRLRNMVDDSEIGASARKALRGMMTDLHLSLLSERSAMQSGRFRKGVAGADKDMMRAFATQGRATAHFIANLENSDKINESLAKMREQADDVTKGDRRERRDYYNELMRRHSMNLEYKPSPFIEKAMKTASVWMLLTSPAHYVVNMTQPYVVSLPVMSGRHGYARAAAALFKAYQELLPLLKGGKLHADDYAHLPADVREAVNRLTDRGFIDISLERELGESNTGAFDKIVGKLRGASETVEKINRLSTAIAALRLEREANPNAGMDSHVAYAGKIINDTHGDYSGFNAPRVMRGGVGRLMTQFRKYQLIQISMYTRLLHEAFKGATPNEKFAARKALGFSLGHMAILGGALGMPGAQMIGAILRQVFGDDDEPDNPELTLRKMIGDETTADLLLKGVPKLMGVDLSGRLGAGGMLSVLPYADASLDRKGYESMVMGALGPFLGGMMPNIADGAGKLAKGQFYEGLTKMMPKGFADAYKAAHLATEGMTQKNGDQIMKPEEVSLVDAAFQAMGLPTNTLTDRSFRANAKYELDSFYKDKMGGLKRKYVEAYREGDAGAMQDVREEWMRLDAARKSNGYKPAGLQELMKAPAEAKKREASVVGNLETRKKDRGVAQMLDDLS